MIMSAKYHYDQRDTALVVNKPTISEATLMRRVLVRASELGARLFRNTTGRYRLARPECRECQSRGRVITSGLCVGSSDLIGWRTVTVTPAMVGRKVALFVAIELKAGSKVSTEQAKFLAAATEAGALASILCDVDMLPIAFSMDLM